jgi:hypothetical protein
MGEFLPEGRKFAQPFFRRFSELRLLSRAVLAGGRGLRRRLYGLPYFVTRPSL